MNLYKKIVQTVTPPPRSTSTNDVEHEGTAPPSAGFSRVDDLVHNLLDPDARKTLRRMALADDGYRLATRIHSSLKSLRPRGRRDAYHTRCIGYELLGELYLKHLRVSVRDLEDCSDPMGPNVFRGFCVESIDAFFSGDHMKLGIEGITTLADSLLYRAISSKTRRSLHLALANEAISSLVMLAEQQFDRELTESRREYREYRKKKSSRPDNRPASSQIGKELDEYLHGLAHVYQQITVEFGAVESVPPLTVKELRTNQDATKVPQQLDYFDELLHLEHRKLYLPFSAAIKTQVGYLRERWKKDTGKAFFRSAAREYEKQAELERDLLLSRLCKARLLEARTLYLQADRPEDAARLQEMI